MIERSEAKRRYRKGVTAVEFAMLSPVVFLLLFSSLEFMRANNLIHTVDNAVYEAARAGIVPGATAQQVEDRANAVLATIGAQDVTVAIAPDVISNTTDEVTVDISVPMNSNGFVAPFFMRDRIISSSITMSREAFSQTNVGP